MLRGPGISVARICLAARILACYGKGDTRESFRKKMKDKILSCVLLLGAFQACQSETESKVLIADVLAVVRRFVASAEAMPAGDKPEATFSGVYTSSPPELTKRAGPPLRGDYLLLFPDGDFIYEEWMDIMPLTIFDKGKWRYEPPFIRLISDNTIVRVVSEDDSPRIDQDSLFAPIKITVAAETQQFVLCLGEQYRRLQKAKDSGDDLHFLIQARQRQGPITEKFDKARILKEHFRPEYYGKKP